jgi:hypothetical protein
MESGCITEQSNRPIHARQTYFEKCVGGWQTMLPCSVTAPDLLASAVLHNCPSNCKKLLDRQGWWHEK